MVKVALHENGYGVSTFTDPFVALKHLLNNPNKYQILISDYRMPNLNGCELGAKVKELNGNIKVILMSAYDSIEDNNILNFELIRKPFSLQKLLDMINVYLYDNAPANHYSPRRLDETWLPAGDSVSRWW